MFWIKKKKKRIKENRLMRTICENGTALRSEYLYGELSLYSAKTTSWNCKYITCINTSVWCLNLFLFYTLLPQFTDIYSYSTSLAYIIVKGECMRKNMFVYVREQIHSYRAWWESCARNELYNFLLLYM
jgi:hypothetical protein